MDENREDVSTLKDRLAAMESHFHGSSSGLDPLISYLDRPLLVRSHGKGVEMVSPPSPPRKDGTLFLLNTGRFRKTEALVNLFLEKCKFQEFKDFCQRDLLSNTNACITHFLEGDMQALAASFRQLSSHQLKHFRPMIPKLYRELWQHGLDSHGYSLKLCGAGGGGFLLGFSNDLARARRELEQHEIRPLFGF